MALVRVIRCAIAVWAAEKVYDVVAKFWTTTIIARKCYVEMWTNSIGGADVLGPA